MYHLYNPRRRRAETRCQRRRKRSEHQPHHGIALNSNRHPLDSNALDGRNWQPLNSHPLNNHPLNNHPLNNHPLDGDTHDPDIGNARRQTSKPLP